MNITKEKSTTFLLWTQARTLFFCHNILYVIFVTEKVEQFLQHNLAENQDVLADLGYLLALTLHDWQRWDENRDITQNTLLCIELESDPT